MIAEAVILLAEREFAADKRMANLRSLGPEKVLGIFKSKNKRRQADQNPNVHQAMNYLYVLPEEDQRRIADRMIEIINHIFEYLQICSQARIAPLAETVGDLTRIYVYEGTEETTRQLNRLRQQAMAELNQAAAAGEKITHQEGSLRIQRDDPKS